jgi:hypothetical protein
VERRSRLETAAAVEEILRRRVLEMLPAEYTCPI